MSGGDRDRLQECSAPGLLPATNGLQRSTLLHQYSLSSITLQLNYHVVTKYYCPKSIIGIQEALNAFQAVLGFPIVMVSMTKGRVPKKNVVKSMVFCRLKQIIITVVSSVS